MTIGCLHHSLLIRIAAAWLSVWMLIFLFAQSWHHLSAGGSSARTSLWLIVILSLVSGDQGACNQSPQYYAPATILQASMAGLHWAISECHSHPLSFSVEFTHIQHQVSLSSVTSPSANRQPAIHKWGTSGEVDLDWSVVFRCTPAHPLATHGNLCTLCSSYKPGGIHECSTFDFIFIDN